MIAEFRYLGWVEQNKRVVVGEVVWVVWVGADGVGGLDLKIRMENKLADESGIMTGVCKTMSVINQPQVGELRELVRVVS